MSPQFEKSFMSVALENPSELPETPMNCLEVRGGRGSRHQCYLRPGIDVCIWSQASDDDNGDLHLLSSCASGRITRMMLADIFGCDSIVPDIAVGLRELMMRNINTIQQSQIVQQVGSGLAEASRRGGFASMLISTYFAPTRTLTICNAGHPPPLLFRAHSRRWSVLNQPSKMTPHDGAPLGVIDSQEFQHFKTKLDAGDTVMGYSNALTECRTDSGQTLGVDGLIRLVDELQWDDPSDLASAIIEKLRAENPENNAVDDATVMVCKATNRPTSWLDNLLAPLRLFQRATDNTHIH